MNEIIQELINPNGKSTVVNPFWQLVHIFCINSIRTKQGPGSERITSDNDKPMGLIM